MLAAQSTFYSSLLFFPIISFLSPKLRKNFLVKGLDGNLKRGYRDCVKQVIKMKIIIIIDSRNFRGHTFVKYKQKLIHKSSNNNN